MLEQKKLNKALIVLFALIPCVIYNVASIHQYMVLPKNMPLSQSPLLQAIGSFLLLTGLYVGFISILWEKIQRVYASKSAFAQSVIFRSFLLIPLILLTFCYLNMNGNSVFFDVKDTREFIYNPIGYLLNGVVFSALFIKMKKTRVMVFPIFILYIIVSKFTFQGIIKYGVMSLQPSYCENADLDSVAYIVCNTLGPDVPRLIKENKSGATPNTTKVGLPNVFYLTHWRLFECIMLPENDAFGKPCGADTVIGVAQHELGHRKYFHPIIFDLMDMIADMIPVAGAQILLDYPAVFAAVSGGSLEVAPIVAYSMSEVLTSILGSYLKPLTLLLARQFEFQADSNIEAPYVDSVSQFLKDCAESLGHSKITTLHRALRHHHPATEERIARMKARIQA